jgi:antagonist of KipI
MKVIEVLDGGMLTTVQDAGRFGFQRYGVPVSGAMDLFALRAANRLAGNDDEAAGLEMTLLGPRLRFLAPASIALAGADLDAALDGRRVARWKTVKVAAGATLAFGGPRDGIRGYLAVSGGIDVPIVLGSRSTYTRSKLGGFDGRALKAGDVLQTPFPSPVIEGVIRRVPLDRLPTHGHEHRLRVILGPQNDRFTSQGVLTFFCSTYTVTPQSDRMGYRFSGPKIEHAAGPDIVSDGTPLGAVQVAGDGLPIVLMADRGTAGGYTKIATVISVDVWRLSQAAPGDTVRFEAVTIEEAIAARRGQEAWLDAIVAVGAALDDRRRKAAMAAAVAARVLSEER